MTCCPRTRPAAPPINSSDSSHYLLLSDLVHRPMPQSVRGALLRCVPPHPAQPIHTVWISDPKPERLHPGSILLSWEPGLGGGMDVTARLRLASAEVLLASWPDLRGDWGRKVSSTRALGEGRHEVTFADGTTLVTSLLVGADGAWSRIRPLLSDATPTYTGTSFVETYLYEADTRHPAAAKAVGGGMMIAPSPGREIFAHRESGDTLHMYVALAKPLDWFAAIDFTDAAAATARIAAEFEGWAPELTGLITDSDTAPVLRSVHALPVGHRWDRVPGVTLLGDAAHLAAPNGEGANLAMLDGAELGKAIAAHPDDAEAALAEYEQAMFARSTEAATFEGGEMPGIDS